MEQEKFPGVAAPPEVILPTADQVAKSKLDFGAVGQDPVGTKITQVNLGGTSASELGPEHDVITTPSKN